MIADSNGAGVYQLSYAVVRHAGTTGPWQTRSNWQGNVVPRSPNRVVFSQAGAYGVDLAGPTQALAVNVTNGNPTFNLNSHTLTIGQDLRLSDPANATPLSLTISQGTVKVGGNVFVDSTATLLLAPGGNLLVDYSATSPYASLLSLVSAGKIATTPATNLGVGIAEVSSLSGQNIAGSDATSVVMRHTLLGDTDLDGQVNFADLVNLARNFNRAGLWINGDSDHNGMVDFADLVLIARNFNQSLSGPLMGSGLSFDQEWDLALNAVPEPTTLAILGAAGAFMLRRRNK